MTYIGESSQLFGANETYIAELYSKWAIDPNSVDPGWADFFETLEPGDVDLQDDHKGPSWTKRKTAVMGQATSGQGASLSDYLSDPDLKQDALHQLLAAIKGSGTMIAPSSSIIIWVLNLRPCVKSSRSAAKPIAAILALNFCTSRTPKRNPGFRKRLKAAGTARISPIWDAARSWNA